MNRRLGALACIGLVAWLAGCGEEDSDSTSEKDVRECLAGLQIGLQPPGEGGTGTGYAQVYAPDFTAYTKDGVAIDVVVEGTAARARQTAADVRSAIADLGAGKGEVVSAENVVAVFSAEPSEADRSAIRSCLGG